MEIFVLMEIQVAIQFYPVKLILLEPELYFKLTVFFPRKWDLLGIVCSRVLLKGF